MASIFTKIISGEIPSYKIAETEHYFAFLDIRPLVKGHVLAVPKMEVDYIFDLPDEVLSGLMTFSKKVGRSIEAVVPCKRVGILVVGTEVPHAHIHLIPFTREKEMNLRNKPVEMSQEEFVSLAEKIADKFNSL
ncbi:MAG: HIT family protein [Saprospiraceae bacterium]|nr:HIT family protein [Saprospiraceae bacterium]MCB9324443.1 HIT family protein [Lewinellaceae bacterium]